MRTIPVVPALRIVAAAALAVTLAASIVVSGSAQVPPKTPVAGPDPNQVSVQLVRQDQSDCTNSTVNANDPDKDRGFVSVLRNNDGTTSVKVAITVTPNTSYHFFLKCVRLLGDIHTGDEGTGVGLFTFRTNETGNTFAFDMYPEGAPAGNKYQSVTVQMR